MVIGPSEPDLKSGAAVFFAAAELGVQLLDSERFGDRRERRIADGERCGSEPDAGDHGSAAPVDARHQPLR
ncbi:MAG: hypothetical protein ACRENL_11625 [Candidatus Dormibacteria bacterium]